ncbi:MAG: hypothetical protein ACREMZ_08760 [Gemmatimonadales bacterium]
MKTALAALTLLLGIAACDTRGGQDTGRVGETADTMITPRQTQDTTIVTNDTMVETDTVTREGDVDRDTAPSQ